MTITPLQLPHNPANGRSQATAIEQSRAAAEVYASVLVAHERPRDAARAIEWMKQACGQPALAERAFFRYSRGGQSITGATVQLARELARCWGNINYGVSELRRDDRAGESEMLAFAWDIETNARSSHTFIVKHLRDTKQGTKQLTDQRDIYEINANNAARRVREAIFAVLPVWFVEQAKDLCTATIKHGGGVPLPQRIAGALEKFASIRVTRQQLESKLDVPSTEWTEHDVAQLGVIFQSIQRGETTKDDEFPVATGPTTEEITARAKAGGRKAAKPDPAPEPDPRDEDRTDEYAQAMADEATS